MPRSPEEKRRLAEKYGRRHRLLRAEHSEQALETEVKRLVAELRASRLPPDRIKRLLDDLRAHRDVRRHRSAIWAIVDALEALQNAR
ncbi:hypothetical protein A7982_12814 [Minicystis rosea]|nr:hypothetical protein A7982_12814 [Minicystis rosea]